MDGGLELEFESCRSPVRPQSPACGRGSLLQIKNLISVSILEMKLVTVNQPILNTIAAPVSPAAQPAHRPYPPPSMTTSSISSAISLPAVGPWGWP
jgi:hypothetical protein